MKNFGELDRQGRIERAMSLRKQDLCLVLENLTEEMNVAAILRTAEGLGVGKVCIIYRSVKPQVRRGAAKGAAQWLKLEFFKDSQECLEELKGEGFRLVGALVEPGAKSLWEENFSGKVAIMVGNEAQGLSEVAKEMADDKIYLPMLGLTESLNVGVAAGIFLYEVIRQKEKLNG